jgi:hypothetical protein
MPDYDRVRIALMLFDRDAFVNRSLPPKPSAEGDKSLWNDLAFNQRMLREDLSQDHDTASRPDDIIDL